MTRTEELLALAAKAAGIDIAYDQFKVGPYICGSFKAPEPTYWNPLTDDGDALRLAVKLGFMDSGVGFALVLSELQQMIFPANVDPDRPYAATRRAIVRAAAEIGKEMKWHAHGRTGNETNTVVSGHHQAGA
jgi:hypothetical protein